MSAAAPTGGRADGQIAAFDLLADPAQWPAGLGQPPDLPIERIDTHGAALFLGDSHVLKAKRAVRFPFLDFTALAQREAACRAELRLNRRTAAEMYLGVGAVVRDGDGLSLRADEAAIAGAEVVEWVVVMRRFDRDGLLRDLVGQGRLSNTICDQIAAGVAELHLSAAPRFDKGGAAALAHSVDGALAEIAAHGRDLLPAEACQHLGEALGRELATATRLLEDRRRAGMVRHVHGDLHLANICMFRGRPVLFDCIEFNEDFAVIDLLYDLAFLLMDLWHLRRPDAANRIFNLWLEAMHGQRQMLSGLSLLPLFLTLRAAIRTHVHCSIAAIRSDTEQRLQEGAIACGYLAASQDYLQKRPAMLLAVGGVSGTGKSSLARCLAPLLGRIPGAVVLRSDAIRKAMWGVQPAERLPAAGYAPRHSDAVYARMRENAAAALRAGHAVVADAVHADPAERAALEQVAQDVGVPFCGLWLDAPDAVLRDRLEQRRGDVSDADSAVMQRQRGYDLGQIDWHRLDAGTGLDGMLAAAATAMPEGWLRDRPGMT